MADVYKTSLGIRIEVSLGIDLTNNTGVTYRVSRPDNTFVTWTATVDSALAGTTHYLTLAGEVDTVGGYTLQPKVTFAGKIYYGTPVTFNVLDVLP